MQTLVIAEKPELAEAIALGYSDSPIKHRHYFDVGNNIKVIWCYGHMLELKKPEDYNPDMEEWRLEYLPYNDLLKQELKPIKDKESQLNRIISLGHESDLIIHAGDPDPEGQLIIDEVIEYAGITTEVKRLHTNDISTSVIKKAINNLKDNADYKYLGDLARARGVADLISGFNMTAVYSVKYRRLLAFGRVSSPILSLVVNREKENKSFIPTPYAEATASFDFTGANIKAKMILPEHLKSEDGLISDKSKIEELNSILTKAKESPAVIIENSNEPKKKLAPLPYNLLRLQIDCGNAFGYSSQEVLEITQDLRDKHKAITYNRSDCRYLNDDNHEDVPLIIDAIIENVNDVVNQSILELVDTTRKGRAFNSKKVTAHTAIVPTQTVITEDFTKKEKDVYSLIAKRYLAQFLPDREYYLKILKVECNEQIYQAQAQEEFNAGWRSLIEDEEKEKEEGEVLKDIQLKEGSIGKCITATLERKKTRAPQLYTEPLLMADLVQVSKYVSDPDLKKALIDKDKGTEEKGGIGTESTRSAIIENLFERGYLIRKGKTILPSEEGKVFYELLPEEIKYPDLTAKWQISLNAIEDGSYTVNEFISQVHNDISTLVDNIKNMETLNVFNEIECECGGFVRKYKGKNGLFWACDQFDTCDIRYEEIDGKVIKKVFYPCECGGKVQRFTGKNGLFWACDQFDTCDIRYEEINGKPSALKSYPCECGGKVQRFTGKNGLFWACDQFDTCDIRYEEIDGKVIKKVFYPCECGGKVQRFTGKNGLFWACDQFDTCDIRYEEINGKPSALKSYPCECGGKVQRFTGKNGLFWACDQFDTCDIRYEEINGEVKKKISFPCECGGSIYLNEGKQGHFWSCNNYKKCSIKYENDNGKPVKKTSYPCECGGSIYLIEGNKGDFWSCNNYKKCGHRYEDVDGKPKKEKTLACECGGTVRRFKRRKGTGFVWTCDKFKKCKIEYGLDTEGNIIKV